MLSLSPIISLRVQYIEWNYGRIVATSLEKGTTNEQEKVNY